MTAKAIRELEKAAALGGGRILYEANREAYRLLRYPARIMPGVEKNTADVHLIDWKDPLANHFAIAEEVTVAGGHTKRPDLVLYVNGIAIDVIELKRSTVSVGEGIRQNLSNPEPHFIRPFFKTAQLVMAGNEGQGLRYGVIGTPEEHWRRWKEMDASNHGNDSPLLSDLAHLCARERLLEVIHDFVAFDAGVKKVCRPNQYFGVKAAQGHVKRREGGIIWHTAGQRQEPHDGIAGEVDPGERPGRTRARDHRPHRTRRSDRRGLHGGGEDIHRTASGADLAKTLADPAMPLVCSLVQKFGASGEGDIDRYVRDLSSQMGAGFRPAGDIYVFVDECHRTQSGKLHGAMTKLLPEARLIGFTGTPLLKSDKRQSIETFGPYIHTYKYDEAIGDEVVLDLRYEARDIDQHLTSEAKVDQWFNLKTKGLSDLARAQLRRRWGTMQKVTSSRDRSGKIVNDILFDMETKDRLMSGRGNAMLVSDSVYAACRFFRDFSETDLKGKCAIVTSYRPAPGDISGEETGAGVTAALLKRKVYRHMLADHFGESEDKAMHRAEEFEEQVKGRFVNDPGQMKLLIVVDKLLTGFDAPPATYLYIDKKMRDHGLFQGICRVNRLDGEDRSTATSSTTRTCSGHGDAETVARQASERVSRGHGLTFPMAFVVKPPIRPAKMISLQRDAEIGPDRLPLLASSMAGLKPPDDGIRSTPPFGLPKRPGRSERTRPSTGGVARSQVDPPRGGTGTRVHRHRRRRDRSPHRSPSDRQPRLRKDCLNGFPEAFGGVLRHRVSSGGCRVPDAAPEGWSDATMVGQPTSLVFLGIWQLHYLRRALVYPLRTRTAGKKMPLAVMASGIGFNVVNAYVDARFVSEFGADGTAWLADPRFLGGLAILVTGLALNVHSDNMLRGRGDRGYAVPRGGAFRCVSCPNHLGEMVEWLGWAVAPWSYGGLALFTCTAANLVPRALSHHRWYRDRFDDYPAGRKAVIPRLL